MGLYRPTFTRKQPDGTTEKYRSPNWSYRFTDPRTGREIRGSTRTADKSAAKLIYAEAQRRAAEEVARPYQKHFKRPLAEHVEEWRAALLAKGRCKRYVNATAEQVLVVLKGCRFVYWPEISASRAETFIGDDLRGGQKGTSKPGARTRNDYLRAFKQFAKWLVADRRAPDSPVAYLHKENVQTDRRHIRRALTASEQAAIVNGTASLPDRLGVPGWTRALMYELALSAGLRANEIKTLMWGALDLDADIPTVTVAAQYAKARRPDVLPLTASVAGQLAELRNRLGDVEHDRIVFTTCDTSHWAAVLRDDMADLRAKWIGEAGNAAEQRERERSDFLVDVDGSGDVVDFHALRHSFITNLARAGVHPKVAQDLARHTDINLTMRYYTHTLVSDRADALRVLPDLRATAPAGTTAPRISGQESA